MEADARTHEVKSDQRQLGADASSELNDTSTHTHTHSCVYECVHVGEEGVVPPVFFFKMFSTFARHFVGDDDETRFDVNLIIGLHCLLPPF